MAPLPLEQLLLVFLICIFRSFFVLDKTFECQAKACKNEQIERETRKRSGKETPIK